MKFHFKADCTFEADDIDHALLLIATHFLWCGSMDAKEEFLLKHIGRLEVLPEDSLDERETNP